MIKGGVRLVHFKILNVWFISLIVLQLFSILPHRALPISSWINYSLFVLIFITSIFIYRDDKFYRPVFLTVLLYAFIYAFSLIQEFIGAGRLLGDDLYYWVFFTYRWIALYSVFSFTIIATILFAIFDRQRNMWILLGALAIVLPAAIFCFQPFISDPYSILKFRDPIYILFSKSLLLLLLPLIFLFAYAFHHLGKDRPISSHINSLIAYFFIALLMDFGDLISRLAQLPSFSYTQYIQAINLIMLYYLLFNRLNYLRTDFGKFYEQMLATGNTGGLTIKRKRASVEAILSVLKVFLAEKRNIIVGMFIIFVGLVNFLNMAAYVKVQIFVVILGVGILCVYCYALFHKRARNGNILKF